MYRSICLPLVLVCTACSGLNAQLGDLLGNPSVNVTLTHPAGLGIQAKRVAFGQAQGPCSDQLIDNVIADFVQNKVEVVDRQNLNTLMAEHNFSLSGYVDQKSASELGKILGPAVLIFIKVQRCNTEMNRLYEDRRTYNKNQPVVRVLISRTRAFFVGSIQTVDLATGRIFAAKTIQSNPSRQNESANGQPEFPSEYDLRDASLRGAATSVHRMFFPWTETKKLIFFDDNDCGLKQAYQLLKAGDSEGTLRQSEANLAGCKSAPKVQPKTLGHAYYNVGMANFIRDNNDKALENFREAARLRPGDVVNQAITLTQQASGYAAQMQAQQERMVVEANEATSREQEQARREAEKQPKALTTNEIAAMRQAGLSEELIATRIRKQGRAYDLSLDEMVELKNNGLSESLIKVMLDPSTEWKAPVEGAPVSAPASLPFQAPAKKATPK